MLTDKWGFKTFFSKSTTGPYETFWHFLSCCTTNFLPQQRIHSNRVCRLINEPPLNVSFFGTFRAACVWLLMVILLIFWHHQRYLHARCAMIHGQQEIELLVLRKGYFSISCHLPRLYCTIFIFRFSTFIKDHSWYKKNIKWIKNFKKKKSSAIPRYYLYYP